MLGYMNEKYEYADIQKLLDAASALDARFKMQYISADNIPSTSAKVMSEMEIMVCKVNMSRNIHHFV